MDIAFCFNVKHTSPSKNLTAQKEADFDTPEIIDGIKKALEAGGHNVFVVEANPEAYLHFLNNRNKFKIVFNVAEGLGGEAREAQIPAILEMLKIPYTHSGPLTQAISLDKTLTKIVLLHYHIPTPNFQLVKSVNDAINPTLAFPLIVKPNSEGSSTGIFNDNLVYDQLKLAERIKWLLFQFKEPVLVEEYIAGREFTVALLGNNPPKVLPIVEQNFSIFPENMPHFTSYEAKWLFEDEIPNPHDAYFCPADISPSLKEKIAKICLKTFQVLDCKDVCRIDLRLDKNGQIYVLEVNTLPGLNHDPDMVSYLPIAARVAGFTFEGLVNTILNEAIERYEILPPKRFFKVVKNFWPKKFLSLEH